VKILISDPIDEKTMKELKDYGELLKGGEEAEADVIIVRSRTKVDKNYIDKVKNLKLVIRAGVGLDNIDVEYCNKKGIKVENTPEAPMIAVTELVFAHMLSIARNIVCCTNTMKRSEWCKKDLIGFELSGKTLGIIGLGRIGNEVAKRAEVFGMNVLACDSFVKTSKYKLVELPELLRQSDIITLHVPLTERTKNMIDEDEFRLMKDEVVIINTSRGGIINEEELIKNLKNRKVSFAGLDVYEEEPPKDSPFLKLDNVVLTPHIGAQTVEAKRKIGKLIIEKIKLFIEESE
jgi:D-3-phosphoglycerate dehydrogenase